MIKQMSMQPQYVFVDDIKKYPNLIAQILLKDHDVSVIFEKRGRNVKYSFLKLHDQENLRLLDEAKNEHKRLKENGYNHEQGFEDFEQARKNINDYL
ncbi:MAG: hypothetical protein OMM_07356 [Candidatus Magnetoglobus multicellularis str. Araruama]|uniref:Uncharacterized protein n=1 Tax=Candidatus Magnetoglobus multicellularis str. Araruama TaxID=890399 RepID=A0A1V1PD63_9BACT|nr:MAG: hypothetical protein OMM_07356 [Candidatus Magnetoglobus multicellularis str. Araruama]